jgi:hypothetical protein
MIKVYGGLHRGPCRTERAEQIDAISWLTYHYPVEATLTFHAPNETAGNAFHHAMRAKEGVKAGVPDIIHLGGTDVWRAGLFEMKRLDRTKSRLSDEQREFLESASERGCFAAVCYGFEAFKEAWIFYMSGLRS